VSLTATSPGTDQIRLVGVIEICDLLQPIIRQGVRDLTCRDDFPAPFAELAEGDVWLPEKVEAWISAHGDALADMLKSHPTGAHPPDDTSGS
jgi:hypothetical protein